MLPITALAVAAVASLPAVGALADAGRSVPTTSDGHTVVVRFTTSLPASVVVGGTCDTAGSCLGVVTSPPGVPQVPTRGNVQAVGVLAGAVQVHGAVADAAALNTLVGHVDGCGTGTLTITYQAHYPLGDPSHLGGGEWQIVKGTGTGALADAWGGGTFTVTSIAPDQSSTDRVTGLIHC